MKLDKRLQKILDKMIKDSVDEDGKAQSSKIEKYTKALKLLSKPEAIAALSEYSKRLKREIDRTTMEIETTIPLSSIQIKQIADIFKKRHLISEVKQKINPSLFGGLRIKIGDVVYDDSIKQRINQLGGAIRE